MGARYDAVDKKLNDQEQLVGDLYIGRDMIIKGTMLGIYHPAAIFLDKEIKKQTEKLARWKEKEGVE